jgi:transcriptional regulator with XRE-family HTH domain
MNVSLKLMRTVVDAAKKQGMAQAELARKAKLSPEQLSRLMGGGGGARVETLANLAAVVGLRLALVPDDDLAADLLSGNLIDFTTDASP